MDPDWGHVLILLFLLLPVAAYSGWWTAKRTFQRSANGYKRRLPPEYFKGLNYVLNEQPDKAIEVFIKMLEVDSETVETHLALGNLFRRRGEVDRAIRIHQNLIARPTLSHEERALALLELGMDYMRSGLFDRAEGLFLELVEDGSFTVQAFRQLLDIYQQEKEWDEAIIIARRLESLSGERQDAVIAQFHCELATGQVAAGRYNEARDNLRKALNLDSRCVRASLIEGEIARKENKTRAAIKAYKRVEKQDPEFLSEVVRPLRECYVDLGKSDEYIDYLKYLMDQYGGTTALLSLADILSEVEGEVAAVEFMSSELRKRPTVYGVNRLLGYAISKADSGMRESLIMIKDMTGELLENRPIYKCNQCGFDAKHLHWRCPGCQNWNTVKPVYGVQGE